MKYGLIGEKLGHSFSPRIHAALGSAPYELCELAPEEVESFLLAHDFKGINVTIPYKQTVIPYLAEIDPAAARIGAVNTILTDENGKLHGYNTDYTGMMYALKKAGIDPKGKKALIIGSGGTSRTVRVVLSDLGASEIAVVSRDPEAAKAKGAANVPVEVQYCDYEAAYSEYHRAEIIINTTPVGMYPRNGKSPLDLSRFPDLEGVMDVVFNPLKTAFLLQARELGIPCTGGLPMLVAQAKAAAEYFLDKKIPDSTVDTIVRALRNEMTNIVLIGMPGSGKTTIGRLLAETLEREFVDIDDVIEEVAKMPIPEIFEKRGEAYFRDLETAVAAKEGMAFGRVMATGGGIVLREENYTSLAQNSYIVKLERDLAKLPLEGRPLT